LGIEPVIRILALKDFPSELFCGKTGAAWITSDLAAAVADATDDANELGVRITSKLLNLMDDA
jgi:hypothetical protein